MYSKNNILTEALFLNSDVDVEFIQSLAKDDIISSEDQSISSLLSDDNKSTITDLSILTDSSSSIELSNPIREIEFLAKSAIQTLKITLAGTSSKKQKVIKFFSKAEQQNRFTIILRLLDIIHESLLSNTILTKREIYYRDVELFKSQKCVDQAIDIIAMHLGNPRSVLNIRASPKGLCIGFVEIEMLDATTCNFANIGDVSLIPAEDNIKHIRCSADFVLVIEKEAAMRSLAISNWWNRDKRAVLVTGKGFPDLATRNFLQMIHDHFPKLPFYGLVDHDPHGFRIFGNFKYGRIHQEDHLKLSRIKWLYYAPNRSRNSGMLSMSVEDIRAARTTLFHNWVAKEHQMRRSLQLMLFTGYKCEIEISSIDSSSGFEEMLDDLILFKFPLY